MDSVDLQRTWMEAQAVCERPLATERVFLSQWGSLSAAIAQTQSRMLESAQRSYLAWQLA